MPTDYRNDDERAADAAADAAADRAADREHARMKGWQRYCAVMGRPVPTRAQWLSTGMPYLSEQAARDRYDAAYREQYGTTDPTDLPS